MSGPETRGTIILFLISATLSLIPLVEAETVIMSMHVGFTIVMSVVLKAHDKKPATPRPFMRC